MIVRKSPSELEKMRKSGLLVHQILGKMAQMVTEGITTYELELVAEKMIRDAGAKPAFKGYYSASAGNRYPSRRKSPPNPVAGYFGTENNRPGRFRM